MFIYNVEFAGDHFWIGTTVIATDEDSAIDAARDHIFHETEMSWNVLCTIPHVEADYQGEAE